MSQNNTLAHGKLQVSNSTKQHITAEIMQTYDLLKFALARSNGSSFLLITQYEMRFINKREVTKKIQGPKNTRQMYKWHEPQESCLACLFYLHHQILFQYLRDKKKKERRALRKRGGKIHPFHLPWIRACSKPPGGQDN